MKLFVHHFQLLRRGEEMGFAMLLHSESSQGVFCVLAAILGQHRTIASASLSRLFAPLPQFQKWEIHTVFLHFRNFELGQKFWLRLLAELRGVALIFHLFSQKAGGGFNQPLVCFL